MVCQWSQAILDIAFWIQSVFTYPYTLKLVYFCQNITFTSELLNMMLILQTLQIRHNSSCYNSSFQGVPFTLSLFSDMGDTISRIHVIDTNFTTGVNCTFSWKFIEKINRFKAEWIPIASSSCEIKGIVEMMKHIIQRELFSVHSLTVKFSYVKSVLTCYKHCLHSTRFIGLVCSLSSDCQSLPISYLPNPIMPGISNIIRLQHDT